MTDEPTNQWAYAARNSLRRKPETIVWGHASEGVATQGLEFTGPIEYIDETGGTTTFEAAADKRLKPRG